MGNIDLVYIVCCVLAFVPAIVLHEVAHGFVAFKLGDPTAQNAGRLTLNPLKHIDPFGTVILPLCLLAMSGPIFGYAKPVPYNPRYFKNPKRDDVLVGLAGPAANLLQALVAAFLAWLLYPVAVQGASQNEVFVYFYYLFVPLYAVLNLYLLFFNLIPIPPLDGSSLFTLIVPDRYLPKYYRIQQYAMPIFMVVLILVPYLSGINPIGIYLDATAGNIVNLILPFSFV